jgi:hypothetical protein
MSESVGKAKATLLRALDQLERAEQDLAAEPERVDLIVVYSIGFDDEGDGVWHEVGGWAATAGPKWLHAALLDRCSVSFREASEVAARDDDPDPDDEL